jgi:hypothetical protein
MTVFAVEVPLEIVAMTLTVSPVLTVEMPDSPPLTDVPEFTT